MKVTVPELALIAGTRGMLGAGIGLLAAGRLSDEQRRIAGRVLLTSARSQPFHSRSRYSVGRSWR